MVKQLYQEYGVQKNKGKRSFSDLSDIRTLVEMKDEAIQTFLDQNFKNDDTGDSKESESILEEKEKCDCFSDDNDKLS